MTLVTDASRCPVCGRILFADRKGNMPLHKVPEPHGTPNGKAVPLTAVDAPWCKVWSR